MKKSTRTTTAQRETLVRRIGKATPLQAKLAIANGRDSGACLPFNDASGVEQVRGIIRRAEYLQKAAAAGKEEESRQGLTMLGMRLGNAILAKDYNLFYRLAATLQHGNAEPEAHKLYRDILLYCFNSGTGLDDGFYKPCDAAKLGKFLKSRGHRFSEENNTTPRSLFTVLKKMGIACARKPAGRPRKNPQR